MNRIEISNEYRALRYDMVRSNKAARKKTAIRTITFIITAVLALVLYFSMFSTSAFGSEAPADPLSVTVKEGDCLWDIALNYSDGQDIRLFINEIRKFNNLENGDLYPGMIILIPQV